MKSKFECKEETTQDDGYQRAILQNIQDDSNEFSVDDVIEVSVNKAQFTAGKNYSIFIKEEEIYEGQPVDTTNSTEGQ